MDYPVCYVSIIPGQFAKACELLTEIFGFGPTEGKRYQKRWRIVNGEVNWYTPVGINPMVIIRAFDTEQEDIINYLKKQGVAA